MKFLLDTVMVSELIKARQAEGPRAWLSKHRIDECALSVVTFGEIAKGIALLADGDRKERLRVWMERELPPLFAERILPIDRPIAVLWGECEARLKRTLPKADALIAATAIKHDLTLVTRNARDFEGLGVRTVNPWA